MSSTDDLQRTNNFRFIEQVNEHFRSRLVDFVGSFPTNLKLRMCVFEQHAPLLDDHLRDVAIASDEATTAPFFAMDLVANRYRRCTGC